MEDTAQWFSGVKSWYFPIAWLPAAPAVGDAAATSPGETPATAASGSATLVGSGPSGPGVIVQIYGRHYHNADDETDGPQYVRESLMKALASQKMLEQGISYPVLIDPEADRKRRNRDPRAEAAVIPKMAVTADAVWEAVWGGGMAMGNDTSASAEKKVIVKKFVYRVQFVWQPKSATQQATNPRADHCRSNGPGSGNSRCPGNSRRTPAHGSRSSAAPTAGPAPGPNPMSAGASGPRPKL